MQSGPAHERIQRHVSYEASTEVNRCQRESAEVGRREPSMRCARETEYDAEERRCSGLARTRVAGASKTQPRPPNRSSRIRKNAGSPFRNIKNPGYFSAPAALYK
jgi:hypothetical protein